MSKITNENNAHEDIIIVLSTLIQISEEQVINIEEHK